MKKVLRYIDSASKWTGLTVRWACLALVLVLCFEVLMRYAFDAPTIWAHEMSTSLGVIIVCLGWCFVHWRRGHVRVDVFYSRLSSRGKGIIDVACFLVFFLPLLLVLMYAAGKMAWEAYIFDEVLMQSYWYPPALPIRLVVVLGLLLFLLQGIAEFIRDVYAVAKGARID